MSIVKKVKKLLQEAELYHSQGLLNESMAKYNTATDLVKSDDQIKNKQGLIDGISNKIRLLEKDIAKVEGAPKSPEVSEEVQELIKKMFAFSAEKDEDTVALDGAIALAKFGQYERALKEFDELLKKDSLRVVAAKNILRCHMTLSSADAAIQQYEQWLSGDIFVPNQLDKIRIFFQGVLEKEGVETALPAATTPPADPEPLIEMPEIEMPEIDVVEVSEPVIEGLEVEDDEADEVLDINSIGITIENGPQEGEMVEFNVSFQSGNVISLLISGKDKSLIDVFQPGRKLNDVQYYSPIAIFNGNAMVSAVTEIKTGPRQGDYSVDIKVEST